MRRFSHIPAIIERLREGMRGRVQPLLVAALLGLSLSLGVGFGFVTWELHQAEQRASEAEANTERYVRHLAAFIALDEVLPDYEVVALDESGREVTLRDDSGVETVHCTIEGAKAPPLRVGSTFAIEGSSYHVKTRAASPVEMDTALLVHPTIFMATLDWDVHVIGAEQTLIEALADLKMTDCGGAA